MTSSEPEEREPAPPTRIDRRKARTRGALIAAAQRLFAEQGGTQWSIQEITDAADVGFGSFHHHFASRNDLVDAAIADMLETHARWLDRLLAEVDDPAVVFATSVRLTARLPVLHPQMARILGHATPRLLAADRGLAPRALRDIQAGTRAGRFHVDDLPIALACTAGSLVAVLRLAEGSSAAQVDTMADELTRNVLRMLGLPEPEVQDVVALPLPVIDVAQLRSLDGR